MGFLGNTKNVETPVPEPVGSAERGHPNIENYPRIRLFAYTNYLELIGPRAAVRSVAFM